MSGEEKHWYGLNVTYACEIKAKKRFDAQGIECFLPMRYSERSFRGRTKRLLVPAFRNLIFVRTDEKTLRALVRQGDIPVRCLMDRATRRPAVVSDREMADFIAVAESGLTDAAPLAADAQTLRSGERVRIAEGPLRGVEGLLLRTGNGERIAVQVAGVAVLTVTLPAQSVEKIESHQPQPTTKQ